MLLLNELKPTTMKKNLLLIVIMAMFAIGNGQVYNVPTNGIVKEHGIEYTVNKFIVDVRDSVVVTDIDVMVCYPVLKSGDVVKYDTTYAKMNKEFSAKVEYTQYGKTISCYDYPENILMSINNSGSVGGVFRFKNKVEFEIFYK